MNIEQIQKGDFLLGNNGKTRVVDIYDGTSVYLADHTLVNINSIRPVPITEDLLKECEYTQSEKNNNEWYKEYNKEDTSQVFKITLVLNDEYDDVCILKIQAKYVQDKKFNHGVVTNIKHLHNLQHILYAFELKETFDYA